MQEIDNGSPGYNDPKTDNPTTSTPWNGPPCRQHHLRNGAARRISATLCAFSSMCRMGS